MQRLEYTRGAAERANKNEMSNYIREEASHDEVAKHIPDTPYILVRGERGTVSGVSPNTDSAISNGPRTAHGLMLQAINLAIDVSSNRLNDISSDDCQQQDELIDGIRMQSVCATCRSAGKRE